MMRRVALVAALTLMIAACADRAAAPTARPVLAATAHVGVPLPLDGTASAAQPRSDGAPLALSYRWTLTTSPAGSTAAIVNATLAQATIVPDLPGEYAVRLVVSDGAFESDPVIVPFTADEACRPTPAKIVASPASPAIGQDVSVAAEWLTPCEVAGADKLVAWSWSLVSAPAGSRTRLLQPDAQSPSFRPDVRGEYVIAVQATNALGVATRADAASARATIVAAPCGDNVPSIKAVSATPERPNAGHLVQLAADVEHADLAPPCSLARTFRYEWAADALPRGALVELNDPRLANPSFRPTVPGTYAFSVVATDDLGHRSAPARLSVEVSDCGSGVPAARVVTPASAFIGEVVALSATVADPDVSACGLSPVYSYRWSLSVPAGSRARLDDATRAAPTFTADVPGRYGATLVVTSSNGRSGSSSLGEVVVDACGSVPATVTINAPAGAATGVPFALSAAIDDPNVSCRASSPYSYNWSISSRPAGSSAALSGAISNGTSARVSPSFTPDRAGRYAFSLVMTDRTGFASRTASAVVEVADCSAPLTVSATGPAGVGVGDPARFVATVTDPNEPGPASACTRPVLPFSYVWRIIGQPAGSHARLDVNAGPSTQLVPDVEGRYELELSVLDAAGNRGRTSVSSLVSSACRAPLSASIVAPAGAATGSPVRLSALVTNPNTEAGCTAAVAPYRYGWRVVGRPAGSVADLNASDVSAPSIVPDVAGDYALELVVTDAAGNRSPAATATLSVVDCRAPLTARIVAPAGVVTGQAAALSADVVDPNEPGAGNACTAAVYPLTYAWSLVGRPAGSAASLNASAAASPSFTPDVAGAYSVRLVVVDAAGNRSPPVTADVLAAECRSPLTASITAPEGATTGATVALAATVTNPNDPASNAACSVSVAPLSYAWSLVGRPANSRAQLSSNVAAAPSFTPDVAGTYAVSLVVVDAADNRSGTAISDVVVSACSAPLTVSAAASGAGVTGSPVAFAATVQDPNSGCAGAGVFTYAWSLVSRPLGSSAALNASSAMSPSLVPDVAGDYVVAVRVTNGAGATGRSSLVVYGAVSCAQPFSVEVAVPASAGTGLPVEVSANVTDPNVERPGCAVATGLVYAWSISRAPPGSRAVLNAAQVQSPSLVPDIPGEYELQVIASETDGRRTARASKVLEVVDCSAPPDPSIDAVLGSTTGVPVQMRATLGAGPTDPACAAAVEPYSYVWNIVSKPVGSGAALNVPSAQNPAFVPDASGLYELSLVVTDARGLASGRVFSTVSVAMCSAPPVAVITARATALTGVPATLAATVTSPNDPATNPSCTQTVAPFTYEWSIVSQPAGSQTILDAPTGLAPSLVPDLPGTYVVGLVTRDALGNVGALTTASLSATGCDLAPQVSISATQPRETVFLSAVVTDLNPSECGTSQVTYAWSLAGRPAGSLAQLDAPSAPAPSFVADAGGGTYVVRLVATNPRGRTGTADLAVSSAACASQGPSVTVVAPPAPAVNDTVRLAAYVTDLAHLGCGAGAPVTSAPYSYVWSLSGPAGSRASITGTDAAGSFVADVAGTYTWAVTVTDAFGFSSTQTGTTTVTSCFPVVNIVGSGPLQTYQPTSVAVAFSPLPAGCAARDFNVEWSFANAPATSRATFGSRTSRATTFTPDVPNGTWEVRARVTDALNGASVTLSQSLTSDGCGAVTPYAAPGISLPFPVRQLAAQPDPTLRASAAYLPGYVLQLDASNSANPASACSGSLSYRWSIYSRPMTSSAEPTPANAVKPSFTPDAPGDYVLRLVVSNDRFVSAPSFLRIAVEDPLNDKVPGAPTTGVLWNDSAVDPADGKPAIAFYQRNAATNRYDVKFAKCTANCDTAGGTWSITTVDTNLVTPGADFDEAAQVSLLFLAAGTPAMAYKSEASCNTMKYAVFAGGAWRVSNIDTNLQPNSFGSCGGLIHGEIELRAVGAAKVPAVAYHTHNGPGGAVGAEYAACTANCTTAAPTWAFQMLDATGNEGHYLSFGVDPVSKLPRVAYQQDVGVSCGFFGCASYNYNLRYATCADGPGLCANAQGTWSRKSVLTNNTSGYWTSIAVSPTTGRPAIAHQDTSGGGIVQVATCTGNCGTAASSTWTLQTIEAGLGANPSFPRLQYDATGLARITYINAITRTLRYAVQQTGGAYKLFDIDRQVDDGHSSFILTPSGSAHVSYALTTGLKYYPFGD